MSFLNPLFLTAISAVAIPIVLHLVRRRRSRTLDFPAVRYLRRTTREHARIIRLRQLALLALRVIAITLLVLAGARMILPFGGRDHPPAGLVLIVDNGIASGATLGDGRVLDTLAARADEALERTGAQDRIWVIPAGHPWQPAIPLTTLEAQEAVAALEPTHVTPNLPAQVRRATALLETSGLELREIAVVSDLRSGALPESDPESEHLTDILHIAPPPAASASSRGIEDLRVSGGLTPVTGDPGDLFVQAAGNGRADAAIRAYLEERLVASGRTGEDGAITFSLPPFSEGWQHGRVELDPDHLRGDDVGYFAFPVLPPPRVHLGMEGSPFIADALATLEEAGRLQSVVPQDADVHFVSDELPLDVASGGVVAIVPPDDPALLPATNRLVERLLPGWRLEPDEGSPDVQRRISGGSAVSMLPEQPAVRRAYRIEAVDGATQGRELLTLSDGMPWLVEGTSEDRTVLLLASSLSAEASDVPRSAAMIPLIDLLTSPRRSSTSAAGAPAGHSLSTPMGAVSVRTPDGTLHRLDGSSSFSRTGHAGIYRFLATDGEILELVAVNALPPDTPLTIEEATQRLARAPEEVREASEWPSAILQTRQGREVWRWLTAALLVILLLEAWLAASAPGRAPRWAGAVEDASDRGQRVSHTLQS